MGRNKKNITQKTGKSRKIYEAGLYPLPGIKGGWKIESYYFLKATSGERIIGRALDIPIYTPFTDMYANFVFGGEGFDNILDECDKPTRYQGVFRDRELDIFYIINVMHDSYLPSVWIRFNHPVPFAKALKTVDRLYINAHKAARKYAKEDGFIN